MSPALLAVAAVAAILPQAKPIDVGSWFSSADYPIEALKKGVEGSVRFEVDVDTQGIATACRVIETSGSPILDQVTCKIVQEKGRFNPAVGRNGKPVAGRYSNVASWRLPGAMPAFHQAIIIDFSTNPPSCKIDSSGPARMGPVCEQMIEQSTTTSGLGNRLTKAIYLMSSAPGGETPYRGEPDWGTRISFLASEQYYLKGAYPIACISVAAEGAAAGGDACASFAGPRAINEQTRKVARKVRVELSVFGVLREGPSRSDTCRSGESAAETQSCN